MAGKIIVITPENWEQEVVASEKPVLIDFWASWCAPCRIMAPIMEEIAEKYGDKVKVAKLNVDDYPELATRYGVMSIPTFILFEKGNPTRSAIGAKSLETLVKELGIE